MRWLDVRRHSVTKKGPGRGRGSELSARGVELAAIWSGGPYDRVVTSDVPRALESALAMGCAVDDTVSLPGWYAEAAFPKHAQWAWSDPYRELAERVRTDGQLAAVAAAHLAVWEGVVSEVRDGRSALFVGHGGAIELALVAALPGGPFHEWGAPFGHADGVRLGFEAGSFTSAEFLRAGV